MGGFVLRAVGVCPGVCPGLLGPQSCPRVVRVCPRAVPPILCLKAVRRVVRGFVRGGCPGFKPVRTQNVKPGVYAEPPLSKHSSTWTCSSDGLVFPSLSLSLYSLPLSLSRAPCLYDPFRWLVSGCPYTHLKRDPYSEGLPNIYLVQFVWARPFARRCKEAAEAYVHRIGRTGRAGKDGGFRLQNHPAVNVSLQPHTNLKRVRQGGV